MSFLRLCFVTLLICSTSALGQFKASSTNFISVPIDKIYDHRVTGGFNFHSGPTLELEFAYTYALGAGFDLGAGLHGGVFDTNQTAGILGADLMFRYVHFFGHDWYLGAFTEFGCVYTGLGDVSLAINYGSAFPLTIGIMSGWVIQDFTKIYFAPAVELGQTARAGDPLWKTGVGLRFTVGSTVAINDSINLFLEARPGFADLAGDDSVLRTFNVGISLGALYEF